MKTNKLQTEAITHVKRWIEDHIAHHDPKYGSTVTEFDVASVYEDDDMFATGPSDPLRINAKTDMVNLSETNMLRFYSKVSYFFIISRRGKITMWGGPASMDQFAGKKVFGMHIDKDYHGNN